MELNHLKYFYFAAKEGSITAAAKLLRVNQPAVSRMIKNLENNLSTELFIRSSRKILLTKSGSDLFRECQIIFRQLEKISASFRNDPDLPLSGQLTVVAAEPVSAGILPIALSRFRKIHPAILPTIITTVASHGVSLISSMDAEFGMFFHLPDLPDSLSIRQTFTIPFDLVVAAGSERDPKVLTSFIGSREVDNIRARSYPTLSRIQRDYPEAAITISTNSLSAHRLLVLQRVGVAVLPHFLVQDDIAKGRMKRLYPKESLDFNLKLVARKDHWLSTSAKEFLSECSSVCAYLDRG